MVVMTPYPQPKDSDPKIEDNEISATVTVFSQQALN